MGDDLEEWENGQDLSSMESEYVSDSSDSAVDSPEESDSSGIYSVVLEQDYSTGHFQSYNDFVTVGINGFLIGFSVAMVCALVTLAYNALLNILKKGGS